MLPAAGALALLGAASPWLRSGGYEGLVVVIDASASMAAAGRFERAKERAARLLVKSEKAVLVRAGLVPQVYGPASGKKLIEALEKIRPGDQRADIEAALSAGSALMPGAPLVIGDEPPGEEAYYLSAARPGENAGITALGPDFLALANSGAPREVRLLVDGEETSLRLPAGGFKTLSLPYGEHRVRLLEGDALALDDQSFFLFKRPEVALFLDHPALRRLLAIIGARPGKRGEIEVRSETPTSLPEKPTLYFAETSLDWALVADREAGHPYLLGAELLGELLPVPPPPGEGFFPIASDAEGRGIIYAGENALYLPPLEEIKDLPAFVVMVYNFFAPHLRAKKPLGADGVLTPGVKDGVAYVLENPRETLLPAGGEDRPPPLGGRFTLAPLFFLLAALALAAESRLG